MASNKFATMLHKNSHKMTVILVYTILEWILISLLLLNALFSYLISKFASYFGLRPPCLLCSRVDDLFEPPRGLKLFPDLICEDHVAEISMLGYCPCHRSFPDVGTGICENCSEDHLREGKKRLGVGDELKKPTCFCCGVLLEVDKGHYGDLIAKEPSLDGLEDTHKEDLGEGVVGGGDGDDGGGREEEKEEEKGREEVVGDRHEYTDVDSVAPSQSSEAYRRVYGADAYIRILNQCRECGTVMEERLVSVELVDLHSQDGQISSSSSLKDVDFRQRGGNLMGPYLGIDSASILGEAKDPSLTAIPESENEIKIEEDAPSAVFNVGIVTDSYKEPIVGADGDVSNHEYGENGEIKRTQASEEDEKTDGEISIGSEICDKEHVQPSNLEAIQSASEEENKAESERSREVSLERAVSADSHSISRAQSTEIQNEFQVEVESNHSPTSHDDIEGEEERIDTPTSVDGVSSHKGYMFSRAYKRDGAESTDGSVTSEMDSSEALTIEQLKTALQAERKALSVLYAELEEERSASAIAANQTMAMITRLQEEKAAMHMDALQYQRMVEEQSDYVNEEWQMLNELVMTRENEKAELERELEIYRVKVLKYEAMERKMKKSNGDATLDTVDEETETGEGEDGLSGHDGGRYEAVHAGLDSTADQKSNTQLSAAEKLFDTFEINMLSILEDLKSLERKMRSSKTMEKSKDQELVHENPDTEVCGLVEKGESHDDSSAEKASNGKMPQPLSNDTAENGEGQDLTLDSDSDIDSEGRPLSISDALEDLRIRIDGLEGDREFIKMCIGLMKNGDRCIDLLEEILQRLRCSRTAEVGMENASNPLIVASA